MMKLSGKPPTQHKSKSLTLDWSRKTSRETRTSVFITLEVRAKKKKSKVERRKKIGHHTKARLLHRISGFEENDTQHPCLSLLSKGTTRRKSKEQFSDIQGYVPLPQRVKKKRCVYQKRGIPRSHDT